VRTLTLRELNRATLARQLLLRRRRLPTTRAVERVAGLQGQWPPAPYVGLWTRLEGFRRESLEQALRRQEVIKATVMRTTLHLVSARDYLLFTAALDGGRALALTEDKIAFATRLAERARAHLRDGALSRDEMFERLVPEAATDEIAASPWLHWFALRIHGRIVHSPESAFWKAPQRMRFVALDGIELPEVVPSRVELVRRYLAAFGPATRADLRQWSGMRAADLEPALSALEPLRRFHDEQGRELLDLPRAPLPSGDTPAPVRFLPRFDNLLLSHADRRRVMRDEDRKLVIGGGMVEQTFLVDGFVAGTWSVERGRVRLDPFCPLPRRAMRELRAEAERLEAFMR
jgi:Winged helix DNA-binding domain